MSQLHERLTQRESWWTRFRLRGPDAIGLLSPRPHVGEPITHENLENVFVHVHDGDSHLTPLASASFGSAFLSLRVFVRLSVALVPVMP
jgi:hypothetical protein